MADVEMNEAPTAVASEVKAEEPVPVEQTKEEPAEKNEESVAAKEEAVTAVADENGSSDVKPERTEAEIKKENAAAAASTFCDNEVFKSLVAQDLKVGVAESLMKLFETAAMSIDDVDERAIEMLKSFPEEHGTYICDQLRESMLFGVQNKAQYLMSLMRNFRDKTRNLGNAVMSTQLITGPDREKMKEILDRTGYSLEITVGQRKYGGPPPDWEGAATGPVGQGHEIYIGHIPHELFEDALIPLFEEAGKIWDLRLMMDPITGKNRGYAFLTFCEKSFASEAAKKFDGHEIAPGKKLKVNVSVANTRLYLGNIPKSKSKDEILEELKKHADGVVDVIVYTIPDATERHKNRGFCFVDFVDHKTASDAKRKVQQHKVRPFNTDLVVDWAEQQDEPDEETMSKVKVLYVGNLKEVVTEEKLKEIFGAFGEVERVKKIKDYAFVHFVERDPCVKALAEWHGKELEGVAIDCSLAKPQLDKKRRMQRGRGMGMSTGYGSGGPGHGYGGGQSGPGGYGNRGGARAMNVYPNSGYDDYYGGGGGGYGGYGNAGGGGGYGHGGDYGGGYGGGYGAPMGYGGGGGYGDGGYGGGYQQGGYGGGGGYGNGGGNWGRGGGSGGFGGGGYGGGRGGGGRGAGGPAGRGRGKRVGDRIGGPASKRDNGGPDFSADVNMSSF